MENIEQGKRALQLDLSLLIFQYISVKFTVKATNIFTWNYYYYLGRFFSRKISFLDFQVQEITKIAIFAIYLL